MGNGAAEATATTGRITFGARPVMTNSRSMPALRSRTGAATHRKFARTLIRDRWIGRASIPDNREIRFSRNARLPGNTSSAMDSSRLSMLRLFEKSANEASLYDRTRRTKLAHTRRHGTILLAAGSRLRLKHLQNCPTRPARRYGAISLVADCPESLRFILSTIQSCSWRETAA